MTARAALTKAFLDGKTLSIMNCFRWFGITNLPREASRGVEQPFGVALTRERKEFTSRYGQPGFYFTYKLDKTPQNKPGIEKMYEYLQQEFKSQPRADLVAKNSIVDKNNTPTYSEQQLF